MRTGSSVRSPAQSHQSVSRLVGIGCFDGLQQFVFILCHGFQLHPHPDILPSFDDRVGASLQV
jgi:hypothetical protein